MPNFDVTSNYNKDANFSIVKFGSGARILEAELNELQLVVRDKVKSLIKDRFGNGFYKEGTLSYIGGNFTLANDKAFVEGDILTISSLAISLAEGETAYLDVWEDVVSFGDTIKKYGNEQEVNITNHIMDSRLGTETSQRMQLKYNIVKATGVAEHNYIPIAQVVDGTAVDLRPEISVIGGTGTSELTGIKDESHIEILTDSNVVYHGLSNLAEDFDFIQAFANSTLLSKDVDYTIDAEKITKSSGVWLSGTKFDFFAIKFISTAEYLSATYDMERIVVAVESNTIAHGLANFSRDFDLLQVYVNSTYVARDAYYALNDNLNIAKLSGNFEVGDIINLVRVRFVPNVEIASAGDIDYSNLISGLNATRVQGAIDEVNGKINIYEDQGTDPNFAGVKYKLVVVDGVAFMEVVES